MTLSKQLTVWHHITGVSNDKHISRICLCEAGWTQTAVHAGDQ